ncbi:MAG: hypothetical protein LBR52_00375 [Prevotellaceae bacterium]|jgi:hypothetical protein|nr:hypothetical protein [Prevotellaceae bacterium]
MATISKEAILNKTHYGLTIYSHILQQYCSDNILHLVERDCGLYRNPFNSNKETLHIFIKKENILGNVFDKEFARHEDSENAIFAGDAFDFAELHYKQSGEALLQTLNTELHLHIGEQWSFYKNSTIYPPSPYTPYSPKSPNLYNQVNLINQGSDIFFSFFKAPISNTKPHKAVNLLQIYNAIKGDFYKERTDKLRTISDVAQARKFKASNFDYCTFSGIFSSRNDKALIQHSNMLCVDFDHLSSVELSCKRAQNSNSFEVMPSAADNIQTLFNQLLNDDYFDTLLLFRSPSGDGLKWIIPINVTQATHTNYFLSVSNYLKATYSVEVDKSGKDISRACFLPHDPQAFINPLLLK